MWCSFVNDVLSVSQNRHREEGSPMRRRTLRKGQVEEPDLTSIPTATLRIESQMLKLKNGLP
ncbi:hypothetical protein [Spirosoma endbachense]|uniref:Uncharacterized protein n=1 Tax=Spirosoma endbachense TaxID=2666025 RepID=A0A6P1VUE0_9BACT|nr:hypothetical protein [Spirosoma endbachense]QHV96234.1 hypothetical protein GJR95_14975 [Spirosoma endbachense]